VILGQPAGRACSTPTDFDVIASARTCLGSPQDDAAISPNRGDCFGANAFRNEQFRRGDRVD
jgi:hypothetical protein